MDYSFIEKIYQAFPIEAKIMPVEHIDLSKWNFENLQVPKFLNLFADRSNLFALSSMIESYAARNKAPLVAAFENEARYKFVEERYEQLMKSLPKIWIIGNFNNPNLAQHLHAQATVISCVGTNLSTVWAVVTRDQNGPIGLVANEFGNNKFKGFFSTKPAIVQYAIDLMSYELATEINLMNKVWQ
jgi:RNAse (barnase) inhibitor barstar